MVRVLLDKLTGFKMVKKVSAFYGNQMFITVFKRSPTCPYFFSWRDSPLVGLGLLLIHEDFCGF
jgi:hypothetical protein